MDKGLGQLGDKGLFVKELEENLLLKNIDIAVHSAKDMPSELPVGLVMQSVGEREDPRDVVITRLNEHFADLPRNAVVGTASARRVAQLKRMRPELDYKIIRGNLQTRYNRLMEARGEYSAIILAAAGVHRLQWHDKITEYLEPTVDHIPAVGQGILAVEYRKDDTQAANLLAKVHHAPTETALQAERTVLKKLEGGCSIPLGVYAWHDSSMNLYRMKAMLLSMDGKECVTSQRSFQTSKAKSAALDLAEELLAEGGKDILKTIRRFS